MIPGVNALGIFVDDISGCRFMPLIISVDSRTLDGDVLVGKRFSLP